MFCMAKNKNKPGINSSSQNAPAIVSPKQVYDQLSWFPASNRPIWARQSEGARQWLLSKYQPTDTVKDGWQLYTPNPDSTGVMAAHLDHAFTVEASWGTLSGKPGDFVVKNFEDRDVAYPSDVWIVDQARFRATYTVGIHCAISASVWADASPGGDGSQ